MSALRPRGPVPQGRAVDYRRAARRASLVRAGGVPDGGGEARAWVWPRGHGAILGGPAVSATPYVCGHSGRELDRLDLQGAVFRDITRRVLEAAGLSAGMRVLDVGCGAGDVSLVAAELVGERGSVLGVDRAPASIQAATARAVAQHLRHVTFQVGEISDLGLLDVDALIGRFVLM